MFELRLRGPQAQVETLSEALEALERHGAFWGSYLAVRRVLRCHPWNPGGLDPVPVLFPPGKVRGGAE